MLPPSCFMCHHGRLHPFHDDGSLNAGQVFLWERGGIYAMPDFHMLDVSGVMPE